MNAVRKISRRSFVRTTGVAGSALVLGVRTGLGRTLFAPEGKVTPFEPNVYVSIGEDGIVQLTVHRQEMGQGARTTCCMLLAEELDVDIDAVRVVQATADGKYGPQHTAGSTTVRMNWEPLRRAGAAAREMLVGAAALTWDVPAEQCRTEAGVVIHGPTDIRLGYGEVASKAAELPVPEEPSLKSAAEFRIIGKPHPLIDVGDIIQGKAVFGWDVQIPDMLYASLERSPMVKGTLRRYDAAAARAVRDVVDVLELEANESGLTNNSLAVVARNTWAALQGRAALDVEWDQGPLPPENSDEYRARLEEIGGRPGQPKRLEGDFEAAVAAADRVIEATYHGPYLVHAPMEPPACTARVEGDVCEVWSPTQAPQWTRGEVAGAVGLPESNVTVNVTLLGGGFGRKSKPDFAVEAALLAQKLGQPVRVMWTRQDEVRHGFYRAQNFQLLKATIDADGNPTGWMHRTVFPGIGWGFDPNSVGPSDNELAQGMTNIPYRFPNLQLEAGAIASSVRVGWMRSVCNTFHSFAVNGFMDELARELGRDPVAFHLEMLGEPRILELSEADRRSPHKFDTGRLGKVMQAAAEMANWGRSLPARHGLGFAAQYSFLSYVGMVAHVSVDGDGELTVHEVYCALDCGPVVNPDVLEAQMQGAVAMGLSLAKHGRVTLKDGVVEQGNYDDYPIVRMPEMPRVDVRVLASDTLPTGIGEPGVPPTAPAVANAIFAATGRRIRDLPFAGQDLG
jgi:isoquinoline 1-oxidoreductase beta subunit